MRHDLFVELFCFARRDGRWGVLFHGFFWGERDGDKIHSTPSALQLAVSAHIASIASTKSTDPESTPTTTPESSATNVNMHRITGCGLLLEKTVSVSA